MNMIDCYAQRLFNVQSLHVNGVNPQYPKVVQCEWDRELSNLN